MFVAVGVLLLLALVQPAAAQSGYVSASLSGDVARFSHAESSLSDDDSGSGEALSFALRVGTGIGERWGVELEFARPQEIEREMTQDFRILSTVPPLGYTVVPTARVPDLGGLISIIPP